MVFVEFFGIWVKKMGDLSDDSDDDSFIDGESMESIDETEIAMSRKGLQTPRVSLTEIKTILADLENLNLNAINENDTENDIDNDDQKNNNNINNNNKRRNSIVLDDEKNGNNNNNDSNNNGNKSPSIKETNITKRTKIGKKVYINEYLCYGYLGSGAFGQVLLAKNIKTDMKVAIKILNKSLLRKKRIFRKGKKPTNMLENIFREIAVMKKLNHPNVVKLYEVIDDPNNEKLYLVIEYCQHGSILGKGGTEQKCEPMNDHELIRQYMRQCILGLEYLHKNKVIHGDIKPENLMIGEYTDTQCVKIGDFGVSFFLNSETSPNNDGKIGRAQGTPAFTAPECGGDNKYFDANPTDIWSLGVTLYMMITGICPFVGNNIFNTYQKIQTYNPPIPNDIDKDMRDFLVNILQKDPSKRLNINDMKIHPWITKNNKEPLKQYNDELNNEIKLNQNDIEYALNLTNESRNKLMNKNNNNNNNNIQLNGDSHKKKKPKKPQKNIINSDEIHSNGNSNSNNNGSSNGIKKAKRPKKPARLFKINHNQ